jgi:adenylyltransferase/sulfurtransferase
MSNASAGAHTDRYARQQLIPGWQQAHLAEATVLVVGAGALGNEVLKNLALVGVGHLIIVDMDRIEPSNLSRTVLFQADDVGQTKATTAARALARINPDVRITVLG